MAKEYDFTILKNYPLERVYLLTKQKEGTILEKLGTMLNKKS